MTVIHKLIYWVKLAGQICPSNCWVKLPVEFVGQIHGSNPLVKSAGQIAGRNVARYIRNVARYIKRSQSTARH